MTKNKTKENPKEIVECKMDNDMEEDKLKEKLLIDKNFISYNKKYSDDYNIWWPINVSYAGNKYYPASHSTYLKSKYKNKLIYY